MKRLFFLKKILSQNICRSLLGGGGFIEFLLSSEVCFGKVRGAIGEETENG